jgi:TIR domain
MALTPSQRIKILKEVSNQLKDDEWPEIDLVLTQFQLPIQYRWEGTKAAYVLEMANAATDDVLNGLAEHFELSAAVPGTSAVSHPSFWKEGTLKVFISHLAVHRKFAGELQAELGKLGISAFVAHNDIEPASEWQTEIERALATCDSLVALLHSDFHKSNWTDQEIGFAMGRGVPIFAVRAGQDPYGFIGRFQAFQGVGKAAYALSYELFNAFRKHKQTQDMMPEILITLLENSKSFDQARTRTGFLEELESWKTSFTPRLRNAVKNNSQISGSWGVPDRLETLIVKWNPSENKNNAAVIDDDIPF